MSSPAGEPSTSRDERRRSIGMYVKRMKTILRRDSSSKNVSTVAGEQAESKPAASASAPAAQPAPATTTTKPTSSTQPYSRSETQEERARKLFAKYGLTLESSEWISTGMSATNAQRVQKPIRMRIHRTCHRCQTMFGPERECVNCHHKRCKKCPRYPQKRSKDAKGKGKVVEGKPEKIKKSENVLVIKGRHGGPDRVYARPAQRVRRYCHKCNALFLPSTNKTCAQCNHTRCTKCPRDPPKPKKYPNGYPGDAPASEDEKTMMPQKPKRTYRKVRQRVRWTCEQCQSVFREKSKICETCNHQRCDNCTREPPKRVKREPDPEVVKAVNEKLARLTVSEKAAAS
ncbi:hypothetical protein BDY21DRAFT_203937 [Lineolata rhizophorae]|uniref:Uncharacterized protein n=1 Tax=Lineolata rhizophorae TaxID=578093 RepID=A0A6A6P5T0_9PEZI|nr:hypothetical protein BDY21DRAFT_203937 [Lineolata rhizophorae]